MKTTILSLCLLGSVLISGEVKASEPPLKPRVSVGLSLNFGPPPVYYSSYRRHRHHHRPHHTTVIHHYPASDNRSAPCLCERHVVREVRKAPQECSCPICQGAHRSRTVARHAEVGSDQQHYQHYQRGNHRI